MRPSAQNGQPERLQAGAPALRPEVLNNSRPGKRDGSAQLSPLERRLLLEEIGRLSLLLGRDLAAAPVYALPLRQETGAVADAISPLERLRLLEALWPEMQTALCALTRRPARQLQLTTRPIPLEQSRGGPAVAAALVRTPSGHAAWSAANGRRLNGKGSCAPRMLLSVTPSVPRELPCVPEPRPSLTTDTPANRFVVALLLALVQEASALARLAAFCGEEAEAERMREVAEAAGCWRVIPCLREVNPPPEAAGQPDPSPGGPPHYRALFAVARRLHQPLRFDWAGSPLLCLPSLEAWRLYELWCFLRVGAALRAGGWQITGGELLRWGTDGLRIVPQTGRASRLCFMRAVGKGTARPNGRQRDAAGAIRSEPERLELFYQPLFPSANQQAQWPGQTRNAGDGIEETGSGLYALSHAMQPDIAIRRQERLYLLDAKFRAYAPSEAEREEEALSSLEPGAIRQPAALLEDIDKMHAYRDAIVRDGKPVVQAAWCLFPGTPENGPDRIVYPTATPQQPFGTAGVGALRLRPGWEAPLLDALLGAWLSA